MQVSRVRSYVVTAVALTALLALNRAASAQTAYAKVTSPPDQAIYVWGGVFAPPSITIQGSSYLVTASGTPNATFSVDWNMWLKRDGTSMVANDTSHGSVSRVFDSMGKWQKQGWGTGTNQSTDTYAYTYQQFVAEASANITVGTSSASFSDRHTFTVVWMPF